MKLRHDPARLSRPTVLPRLGTLLLALSLATPALAQDPAAGPQPPPASPTPPASSPQRPGSEVPATTPPPLRGGMVDINFVDADLLGLVRYMAMATGQNFILAETRDLEAKKVTIISNKKVPVEAAYQAFLSALEVHGLTVVKVGEAYKIIKANEAQQSPGRIREGGDVPSTDQYITQIIPLSNVAVSDVREIVDNLVSSNAKVLAYVPTNTLILTDTGYNIRRIYEILNQLDIAAPKATLEIYPIVYAEATELKELIEELYGTAEESQADTSPAGSAAARAARRRAQRAQAEGADAASATGVTAGKESNYITKVIGDERTNSLIVLANEEGHAAIKDLISKLDIDVDPTSRSQIFVYRLEHAKAEDVSQVLQELSSGTNQGSGRAQGNQNAVDSRTNAQRVQTRAERAQAAVAASQAQQQGEGGAIAAFEGVRFASDENTNSLVIVASRDDYEIIRSVIEQLDTKRKQVFVECVILEMSSTDSNTFNLGYHAPIPAGEGQTALGAIQLGVQTVTGLDPSLLSGAALGIFGKTTDVTITGATGQTQTLSVPAFGIALQAIKTMQMVDIVSTPSLLALDNEEAKIVVGRKIPFPTSSGLNSLGQPVVSYQREDVAITLEMTPRVNSENYVTLELDVKVQEIEQNSQINVTQAGFVTSNREVKTVALVGDNQTMVIGGLVASTDTEAETKVPVLGDLPLLGALFRNRVESSRRTNLMVFLTPHIIDDAADVEEIMRVKEAQRQEFVRRFYGRSQDEQFAEVRRLLQYSMNAVDQPSMYRGPTSISSTATIEGVGISAASRDEVERTVDANQDVPVGSRAGTLPRNDVSIELPPAVPAEPAPVVVPAEAVQAPVEPAVPVEPAPSTPTP